MVVCYYISFCYMCIYRLQSYFSHHVILLIGVHHLIELLIRTKKAFLVAAPDLNAFAVIPVLLVLHAHGPLVPAPALLSS